MPGSLSHQLLNLWVPPRLAPTISFYQPCSKLFWTASFSSVPNFRVHCLYPFAQISQRPDLSFAIPPEVPLEDSTHCALLLIQRSPLGLPPHPSQYLCMWNSWISSAFRTQTHACWTTVWSKQKFSFTRPNLQFCAWYVTALCKCVCEIDLTRRISAPVLVHPKILSILCKKSKLIKLIIPLITDWNKREKTHRQQYHSG